MQNKYFITEYGGQERTARAVGFEEAAQQSWGVVAGVVLVHEASSKRALAQFQSRRTDPKKEPCPWCKAVGNQLVTQEGVKKGTVVVVCTKCHAQGPEAENDKAARILWNHREK